MRRNLHLLALLAIVTGFASCTKKPSSPHDSLLLLKVDYLTYKFEGGTEIQLSQSVAGTDTLPVETIYNPPGDFGDITLKYQPSGDNIFAGTIIWMGCGQITYPASLNPSKSFSTYPNPVPMPDSTDFQQIFKYSPALQADSAWMAVKDLKIVHRYSKFAKNIGIFLYTPSVGMGDPADWDYFLIMSK